jgi:hypothetical protein
MAEKLSLRSTADTFKNFVVRLSDFEAHHATSRLVPLPSLGLQNNEQFYLPDIRGLGNPHRKGP